MRQSGREDVQRQSDEIRCDCAHKEPDEGRDREGGRPSQAVVKGEGRREDKGGDQGKERGDKQSRLLFGGRSVERASVMRCAFCRPPVHSLEQAQ